MKNNNLVKALSITQRLPRLSVMVAAIVGAMAFTQASAMLPTPEPALDNAIALQSSNTQALVSNVSALLVSTAANGQEILSPVTADTRLQSGNILEYHGYFTNTNAKRVRKMTVTMTIPEQVELLGGIMPDFPYASVDGNNFARMPLRSRVNNQLQAVALSYYKAVRWDIEGVGLNDTVMVKYRAKVK